MDDVGYDCVVLGNHEFVANIKLIWGHTISDFENNNIDFLIANTYKENNENYVKHIL